MEFHGRRDRVYITGEEEEQLEIASKGHPFTSSSSSPSSCSSTAFRWQNGPSGSSDGAGGSGAAGSDNYFIEKEHMFEKVVTPSDVGKLNRLVIPKQHAEKHFPLYASTNEKGMLLCFEDSTGKEWRFRYSYWNSSQSYVMTKGWSRFVKEKRLDAGDTVSFGRGVGESGRNRLYIDWKRRPENHNPPRLPRIPLPGVGVSFAQPWGSRLLIPPAASTVLYNHNRQAYAYGNVVSPGTSGGQLLYFGRPAAVPRPPLTAVQQGSHSNGDLPKVLNAVPIIYNQITASKRVRLFGVNLECRGQESDADHSNGGLPVSTALQLQPRMTLPLLQSSHGGVEASGALSSSSTSKEQHISLDLYL